MTELKTFKDFAFWGSIPIDEDWKDSKKNFYVPKGKENSEWITKEELKQEAIKWVKNFDKEWGILSIVDKNFLEWYTIDMQLKFKQECEKIMSVAVKTWIGHFFNLTEEELNGKD